MRLSPSQAAWSGRRLCTRFFTTVLYPLNGEDTRGFNQHAINNYRTRHDVFNYCLYTYLQTGDGPSVFGSLPLSIVEISWHRHHSMLHFFSQKGLTKGPKEIDEGSGSSRKRSSSECGREHSCVNLRLALPSEANIQPNARRPKKRQRGQVPECKSYVSRLPAFQATYLCRLFHF